MAWPGVERPAGDMAAAHEGAKRVRRSTADGSKGAFRVTAPMVTTIRKVHAAAEASRERRSDMASIAMQPQARSHAV